MVISIRGLQPLHFTTQSLLLPTLRKKPLENIVRKGENAAFSPFPTMFSTLSRTKIMIVATFNLSSANAFNLDQSRILSFGKELNHSHTMTPFDAPGKLAF